ncbi:phage terminase large subunit [Mesorhizobium australicum]|uniref:phage terminase large subunit n=1 Tax=Mesorhizobium australicum TaxID=536018 RepID=UPI003337E8DF
MADMSARPGPLQISYSYAGPVSEAFHHSSAFVRAIMGPIGSGKSSACATELIWRSGEQAPGPDGKRHTRFAIIRNTYPELRLTSLATWKDWTGGFGTINANPPITYKLQSGDLDMEVIFLALDSEEDVKKLLSLELTAAWINEAREVPKAILDALTGRVGRYPSKAMGGCTWSGIILDTNPCDDQHWFYRTFELDKPTGFELFRQPSGLSPDAENIANLPGGRGYYERLFAGKDAEWLKVYVHGEYGHLIEGKPVYSNFRDSVHMAPGPIAAVPDLPLLIGVDWGLTPAAVITQRLVDGRWLILSELCTEDTGVVRFAQALSAHVAQLYPSHRVAGVYADPAGTQRAQTDERTAIEIFQEHTGWKTRPAPSNDWTMRLEVVLAAFARLVDGRPGIMISPNCPTLRKACNGGYHYRSLRSSVNGLAHDEHPAKNFPSHVAEALQYVLLGGGDANLVMNKVKRRKAPPGRNGGGGDYDLFDPAYGGAGPRKSSIVFDKEFYST